MEAEAEVEVFCHHFCLHLCICLHALKIFSPSCVLVCNNTKQLIIFVRNLLAIFTPLISKDISIAPPANQALPIEEDGVLHLSEDLSQEIEINNPQLVK